MVWKSSDPTIGFLSSPRPFTIVWMSHSHGQTKPSGTTNIHHQVSEQLDELFHEFLDLYQQIRVQRESADQHLKDGFFKLTESRHSMPAAAFDSTSYSGREMLPLIYARASAIEPEDAKVVNGRLIEIDGPVQFDLEPITLIDDIEEADDESDGEEEESKAGVRKRGAKADKLDEPTLSSASTATATTELDLRQSPLQWFGALVPPTLPAVGEAFRASLTPLFTIAALTQQLKIVQRKFEVLSALQQASHVDHAVEHELVEILEKIRISKEKKQQAKATGKDSSSSSKAAAVQN